MYQLFQQFFYVSKLIDDLAEQLNQFLPYLDLQTQKKLRDRTRKINKHKLFVQIRSSEFISKIKESRSLPINLIYQIEYLRLHLGSLSAARKTLFQHKTNVERHLARLYRIRNDLVHSASFHSILNESSIQLLAMNAEEYTMEVITKALLLFDKNPHLKNFTDIYEYYRVIFDKISLSLDSASNPEKVFEYLIDPLASIEVK